MHKKPRGWAYRLYRRYLRHSWHGESAFQCTVPGRGGWIGPGVFYGGPEAAFYGGQTEDCDGTDAGRASYTHVERSSANRMRANMEFPGENRGGVTFWLPFHFPLTCIGSRTVLSH